MAKNNLKKKGSVPACLIGTPVAHLPADLEKDAWLGKLVAKMKNKKR